MAISTLELIDLVDQQSDQAAAGVASMVLASLRTLRDTHPAEYDALIKVSGSHIPTLWDYLRAKEQHLVERDEARAERKAQAAQDEESKTASAAYRVQMLENEHHQEMEN